MKKIITLVAVLVLAISSCTTKEVSERTIIGKGADGSGNTWLIVSCDTCERERIEVERLNDYKIGDKLP